MSDTVPESSEVVQVYLHECLTHVAGPLPQLIAALRVDRTPRQARTGRISLRADRRSYTGPHGRRQVEPGNGEIRIGACAADSRATSACGLTRPRREVASERMVAEGQAAQ